MINKKTKIEVKYFEISLIVNLIAFIVILWLLFTKKTNNQSQIKAASSRTSTPSKSSVRQSMNKTKKPNKNQQQAKYQQILESNVKEIQSQDRVSPRPHQIIHKNPLESTQYLINVLQQQLQLERNQNQLLQQKNHLLEEKIIKINLNTIAHKQSQQVTNLKNQLQFCQLRLNQSMKSQANLKLKLADYETISISMLNHPQYHRLRQLNNTYKDTISKLQNQLLSRHQAKNHYVDLSFHL